MDTNSISPLPVFPTFDISQRALFKGKERSAYIERQRELYHAALKAFDLEVSVWCENAPDAALAHWDDGDVECLVMFTPEPNEPSKYRYTLFDRGLVKPLDLWSAKRHSTHDTKGEAVKKALMEDVPSGVAKIVDPVDVAA